MCHSVILLLCEHSVTYANLDSIAYYTPRLWYSLLLLGYKPLQHITVQNSWRLDQAPEKMAQSRDERTRDARGCC